MFYFTAPWLQRFFKVVICYNTDIIVIARVIIVGSVFCWCVLTAAWWVTDHLSWLRMFLYGCNLYAINNCRNKSVLFGVNFVSGDWSSCIGDFRFLITLFIYRLYSICMIQNTLLNIAAELQTFLFLIPPSGIAYFNLILILTSISFASFSAT